jgi:hypothetical protein
LQDLAVLLVLQRRDEFGRHVAGDRGTVLRRHTAVLVRHDVPGDRQPPLGGRHVDRRVPGTLHPHTRPLVFHPSAFHPDFRARRRCGETCSPSVAMLPFPPPANPCAPRRKADTHLPELRKEKFPGVSRRSLAARRREPPASPRCRRPPDAAIGPRRPPRTPRPWPGSSSSRAGGSPGPRPR